MIYEFLYRGPIPEENRGGTFHVVLLLNGRLVGPLTPTQAAQRGYDLPAILNELSTVAMAERDQAHTERDTAIAERDALRAELRALQQQSQQLAQANAAMLSSLRAKG